ncbi:MAG TPA: TetR family transcriptional regulator [Candidatus Dormibacteraeota bacterium]
MTPEINEPSGLNRQAVVDAALALLQEVGVAGLSMRGLAERLNVKAASLYWHVRDKDQVVELVAGSLLERVAVPPVTNGWRDSVTAACNSLSGLLRDQPAAAEVLIASLPAVQRSRLAHDLAGTLRDAGVAEADAAAFGLLADIVAAASVRPQAPAAADQQALTLAIDSGSWRVAVRAGPDDMYEPASSVGGGGAAGLEMREEGRVIVKGRRGGDRGAVLLNPRYTWYIKVHGGTWNNVLDLSGLRVSGMELDSGAGNVICTLPAPIGVVPLKVNSGLVGVQLHRPAGAAVHALVSSGSVKVRFDGTAIKVTAMDIEWETPGGAASRDRYELTVHSGCVKVSMDDRAPSVPVPPAPPARSEPQPPAAAVSPEPADITALILDGIEQRLTRLN